MYNLTRSGGDYMTKYQLLVAGILVSSVLGALIGMSQGQNKTMVMAHKALGALTVIIALILTYRAFR